MLTIEKEFYTAPQVAKLLEVDKHKIIRLIACGEIRAVDISLANRQRPRWRISRKNLETFLARRSSTPIPEVKRLRKKKDDSVIEFYK